jgi:carboxymethylenebutenolidase
MQSFYKGETQMGTTIQCTAADGFQFDAYRADPDGEPNGAVMVIQEIFGVNQHVREVCDGYARAGYIAVAPAIFDRAEKGVELSYDEDGIAQGATFARKELKMENTLQDLMATIKYLGEFGPVAVVGYCFGGLLTWLCACNLTGIRCASGYYGGGIIGVIDQQPKVPLMLHFGKLDAHIPVVDVEKIDAAHPDVQVHLYDADHGFNCDHRASFNQAAADLALNRTLDFFAEHLNC